MKRKMLSNRILYAVLVFLLPAIISFHVKNGANAVLMTNAEQKSNGMGQ